MPQTHSFKNAYRDMWEMFGKKKAERYNQQKFLPINRVGLTNFIHEEALLRMVLSVEPKTVLDIGCAPGQEVFALAPHCEKVVGVESLRASSTSATGKDRLRVSTKFLSESPRSTIYPTKASTSSFAARSLSTFPNWTRP